MPPIVYVVDDDQSMLDLIRWRLESAGLSVQTYETAELFLADYSGVSPACLLLDMHLPGMSGLELLERHVPSPIRCPVIILTADSDIPLVVVAMKLGATNYLKKPFGDDLARMIHAALRDDQMRLETEHEHLTETQALQQLTPREREVLEYIVLGDSNRMVATRLDLSVRTVEAYRAHVMEKLQVQSLAELVRLATRLGVRPPSA